MAGSARDAAASVEMAAAVWNKPEAPAVTVGASSLLDTLPVGLIRRFPADRQGARSASDYSASLIRPAIPVLGRGGLTNITACPTLVGAPAYDGAAGP